MRSNSSWTARFVSGFTDRTGPGRFTLAKSASHVARYERVFDEFERPRMVELGLCMGLACSPCAWPTTLVGIEYEANRSPHLDRFIDLDLGAVVRPYYGVDQADGDRLREIVAAEFRGSPSTSSSTTPRIATAPPSPPSRRSSH